MNEWDYADGWVLKGDFSKFFYTLLHSYCYETARRALKWLKDPELIDFAEWLLWLIIDSTPDPGIPIGNQSSQLLALLYLDAFDHWLRDDRGLVYGRYMDDFYIIHSDKLLLRQILKEIEAYIKPLGLRLNGKTQILPLKNGIDFLGFHTYLTQTGKVVRKVRAKSIDNMKRKIRKFRALVDSGKITLDSVVQSYASWTGHISHGNTYHLRQNMDAYGWTSVQYRVKAYDAAGAESAYTTSATRTVTNNRPPVISGTDGALGSFSTAAPSYEYTVTDADGHQVDVVEMLDGVTLRSYTVTLGQTNTLTIGSEAWLKVVNGSHTLKIVATDAKDASVTRTLTFTKAVTSVEFEQTLAMEADAMPTKALVNIQGNFPAGCTLQVWICNNGNDASPTWEDITQKARTGQKHYFTNQTKTAAAWGVKVKAKLLRGSATETCYIQSIGGNFA